jgi:hypothetical protein
MTRPLDPTQTNPNPATAAGHSSATYVAPRVTGKRSLEMVTLASQPPGNQTGGRTGPGGPGWIGHP